MSYTRNLDLLNKKRIIYRRDPINNKPTTTYAWGNYFAEGTYECYTLFISVEKYVKKQIEQGQWSPEQIVGRCKLGGMDMVSHERIYQYLRLDKAQGGTLYKHLRHKLNYYQQAGRFDFRLQGS